MRAVRVTDSAGNGKRGRSPHLVSPLGVVAPVAEVEGLDVPRRLVRHVARRLIRPEVSTRAFAPASASRRLRCTGGDGKKATAVSLERERAEGFVTRSRAGDAPRGGTRATRIGANDADAAARRAARRIASKTREPGVARDGASPRWAGARPRHPPLPTRQTRATLRAGSLDAPFAFAPFA